MADLEIAPERSSAVSETPRFPTSAPVLEATQRAAQQTQETIRRTGFLLSAISKQNQAQSDAMAYIYAKDRLSDLAVQTDKIDDLNYRQLQYDVSTNSIRDELNKQYPNLSPIQRKSIDSLLDNDKRGFYAKLAHHGMDHTRRDINKLFDASLRHSALSTSQADQDAIAANFFHRLDAAKGVLSQDEINDYQVKFGLQVKREQFAALAATKPDSILMMHPEEAAKYGILPTDLLKYQNQASQIISNRHNIAEASLKGDQEKNLEWAWSHPNDTARIQQMGRTNQLPGGMATADQITNTIGDKFPPNPRLSQSIVDRINSFTGGPADFKEFYNREIIPQLYHMNSVDIDQIRQAYSISAGERSSDFKNNATDMINDIYNEQDRLMGDSGYGVSHFSGKIKDDTVERNRSIIRQAKARMAEAKTAEELSQIRDYFIKQQDEWYKKNWSVPTKSTTPATGTEDIHRE